MGIVIHTAAAWEWLARDARVRQPQPHYGYGPNCWRPCCEDIATLHGGNSQWGDPLATHQATLKHVAAEFGVGLVNLRDAIETIRFDFEEWDALYGFAHYSEESGDV